MSPTLSCSLFFALLLTTACSTTRLALEPIENRMEVPLTYRTGWELCALESGAGPTEAIADPAAARVRVTFVRLSKAESEQLLGPIGARPAALEVTPADAQRLLDAVQAQSSERLVDLGLVATAIDKPCEVRAANQLAYIAAFELSQTPGMAIGDPIVQVIEDGYLLRLTERAATARTVCDLGFASYVEVAPNLEVELVLSDLERPMRERVIELPGSKIPVTVQEPACMTQRIQTNATLSDARALLIAGIPAREAGQTLLVVLRRE